MRKGIINIYIRDYQDYKITLPYLIFVIVNIMFVFLTFVWHHPSSCSTVSPYNLNYTYYIHYM